MSALNKQAAALRAAGIKTVAVTAEPGGEDAVRHRLTEREVPALDFELRSDPEHKSLKDAPSNFFVIEDKEWDVSGPYRMIQPALIVYGDDGQVIPECLWSWKTMGLADKDLKWDTRVPTEEWAGPIKEVLLVTMRPVMSDLLQSIQERRRVKLGSTHDMW